MVACVWVQLDKENDVERKDYIWVEDSGEEIPVKKMTDNHIRGIMHNVVRKGVDLGDWTKIFREELDFRTYIRFILKDSFDMINRRL